MVSKFNEIKNLFLVVFYYSVFDKITFLYADWIKQSKSGELLTMFYLILIEPLLILINH